MSDLTQNMRRETYHPQKSSSSGTVSPMDLVVHHGSIWMSQAEMATLFGVQRPAIAKQIGKLYKEDLLKKDATCSKMEHTANDGKAYQTMHYNLDIIQAVGGRVKYAPLPHFMTWADEILNPQVPDGSGHSELNNQLITYQSEDGKVSFDVNISDETTWVTQSQMAELFNTSIQNI